MTADIAILLTPGDIVLSDKDVFRVADFPERIIFQNRKTVRVPVKDSFGRTHVLVREEIIKCLRKSC